LQDLPLPGERASAQADQHLRLTIRLIRWLWSALPDRADEANARWPGLGAVGVKAAEGGDQTQVCTAPGAGGAAAAESGDRPVGSHAPRSDGEERVNQHRAAEAGLRGGFQHRCQHTVDHHEVRRLPLDGLEEVNAEASVAHQSCHGGEPTEA
jgi:hypothetical protein